MDVDALLSRLLQASELRSPDAADPLIHVERFPSREAWTAPWPVWVPAAVREAYTALGVTAPWAHQVDAAQAAWDGEDVVVATGTASGKSMAYQLPALSALSLDDRARVLYLSPTKALAADQLRSLPAVNGVRAALYDGDTPPDERQWVRSHANWILTNPDMLHLSLLGGHHRWSSFLRQLRFVVIDECHGYRGLFGAHVAGVLRRLRRICARYGAAPVFVLASATSADPARTGEALIGRAVHAVTQDHSPRGDKVFALWEPPLSTLRGENGAPVRRSAGAEAARVMADLVLGGARTLTFVRSRRGVEITALAAARAVRAGEGAPDGLAGRIAAYRGGYLAEERRALERALDDGSLMGVAATNALELGIDVAGLDAVVLAGYPGTLASLWQQAGRAGRSGEGSLVVFIARDDPLDTYLVHHPDALFARPVEATVFDPYNPYVLAPQLCCASAELPITEADLAMFGGEVAREVLNALVEQGLLRRRPRGWFWALTEPPKADLRGAGEGAVTLVEAPGGRLLGSIDAAGAHASAHPGAVYLHQGQSYVVDALDLRGGTALVHAESPDWTTSAREISDVRIISTLSSRSVGQVSVHLGSVQVSSQVIAYQRRRVSTGEVIDEVELELPRRELTTTSVWYTIDDDALVDPGSEVFDVAGALHAAEHAAIGLLPLFATCDRWDIGGVSTARHPDTGRATVFVYDGHPGGAGFAERGHAVLTDWLGATRSAIDDCECLSGCPSCVQSPKCGNGNQPLDKAGAVRVLGAVLTALAERANAR